MDEHLIQDSNSIGEILRQVYDEAAGFFEGLNDRPAGVPPTEYKIASLPETGLGSARTLAEFRDRYAGEIPGSVGPRYFGFVTGGVTPAALAGDWLTSVFDQNATGHPFAASAIERETISFLRELFNLTEAHSGAFVSGATMANFVGLALARQWVGQQMGVNVAQQGLSALPPLKIFSGAPHSCIYKCLSMLGIGRDAMHLIPCLPDRQSVNIAALREALCLRGDRPSIVVANAGEVNTVDFDDLAGIAALKREFNFWLHVDAAFGGFAACSPKYRHLTEGLDLADSIAIDAHKWMNVPYDSAMQFTRHRQLQLEIFWNNAAYLGSPSEIPEYHHLTPESSRRLRALAAWFSLMAYGRKGYQEIVERTCEMAQLLGSKIAASDQFRLLAPVRMNVVCFTLAWPQEFSADTIKRFLAILSDNGKAVLTPTVYHGVPGMRAAVSNWRTTRQDIEVSWEALQEAAGELRRRVAESTL
ncbi:MAG TPA: pyridoxal-dependent decarboxylase [Blastocatellia bacterium]|nr:pyridoxal-dependent decarboxylase [Blastocatellia bacterium]